MNTTTDVRIEELLVHRDRMLLIRQIMAVDMRRAVALSTVSDQWPLVDGQGVSPLVLVEVTAQTAGIYNSWRLHQEQGPDADHRGWLVGIKHAEFFVDHLPFGTNIITEAQNRFEYEGYREIQGISAINGQTAADITLQIVQASPDTA